MSSQPIESAGPAEPVGPAPDGRFGDGFDDCVPADFGDAVGQLAGVETAVRAQLVQVIRGTGRRQLWADDGARDLAHWVAIHAGVSRATARDLVAVADALPALPSIDAAFARGELGGERVRLLVRYATPESDAELADAARGWTIPQIEAMARHADRLDRRQAEENDRRRGLRLAWNRDRSCLHLTGWLDAPEGAVVATALEREADRHRLEPKADDASDGVEAEPDRHQPRGHRLADALTSVCSAFLGTETDTDRACVVVHTDLAVLTGADGPSELANGVALTAETVRRLACDGRLQVITENPDGTPIGIGRASRTVPAWLRRQVLHRDQGCRFPGCPGRHLLQAHHVEFWVADQGRTDLEGLIAVCWRHHRSVHEGGWTATGNANGMITWTSPHGRVCSSSPPPPRPETIERIAPLLPFPPAALRRASRGRPRSASP